MIKIIRKPASDNWRKAEIPRAVKAIGIHIAEGSEEAVDSWFNNPKSDVSSHFLVGFDGEIRQYASIHYVTFTQGRIHNPVWPGLISGRNPNDYIVSIEHEGDGRTRWPESQLYASSMLSAWLCWRFKLPVDPLRFVKHNEIFSLKSCPGPAFDRENYLERVRGVMSMFSKADLEKMIIGIF